MCGIYENLGLGQSRGEFHNFNTELPAELNVLFFHLRVRGINISIICSVCSRLSVSYTLMPVSYIFL